MLAEFRQEEWRSRDESRDLQHLQALGHIGSNKISYGGLWHNDITDAPRSGKRSRSRVRLSQDKQGQGLEPEMAGYWHESYAEASWKRLDVLLTKLMNRRRPCDMPCRCDRTEIHHILDRWLMPLADSALRRFLSWILTPMLLINPCGLMNYDDW